MYFKSVFGGILTSAVIASAWNLDGTVVNTENQPLEGVNITCYNYGGVTTTSDKDGKFSIGDEQASALASSVIQKNISVTKKVFLLSLTNPSGNSFKPATASVTIISLLVTH